MKKWLKRIFVVLLSFLLLIAVTTALWWPSIRIVMGSGELEVKPASVPEIATSQVNDLTRDLADWPSWQSGDHNGRNGTTVINKDWSSGLKKRWEVDFLCQGNASASWSAPVVQGNRLIVCGRDNNNDLVFCLDPDSGTLLWKGAYEAGAKNSHGTGSRATPCIDDDRVYTFGRSGDLVCWALRDGMQIWRQNVGEQGGKEPTWGHSSSPLVFGDVVIVQGGGSARTVAYNKTTGALVWKSGQGPAGYAALIVMTLADKHIVLAFHGTGLAGLAVETGKELWNVPWKTPYDVNATTPVVIGNQVFITSGYGTGCALIEVSDGNASVKWSNKVIASHHSDPRIVGGFIYGYSGHSSQNKGTFKCVELSTGKEQWAANELGWGTCVLVDGHLLCVDILGNIFLVKPDPSGLMKITELLHVFGQIKGPVWTQPIVANGRLYLRFKQQLVCYDLAQKSNMD